MRLNIEKTKTAMKLPYKSFACSQTGALTFRDRTN